MTVLGLARVKSMVPHRHPMLLLDAVLEMAPGERVRAVKAISGTESCYRALPDDAPPEAYAYPATLLLESWCQCGALLAGGAQIGARVDAPAGETVALLGGVSGVRFEREVFPGVVVEHRARVVRRIAGTWILSGESVVGGATVLRVEEAVLALRPTGVLALPPTGVLAGGPGRRSTPDGGSGRRSTPDGGPGRRSTPDGGLGERAGAAPGSNPPGFG